jgi:hypothetical protein
MKYLAVYATWGEAEGASKRNAFIKAAEDDIRKRNKCQECIMINILRLDEEG